MLMSMTKVQDFQISLLKGSLFSHLFINDEQDFEVLDLRNKESELHVMRSDQVHEFPMEIQDEKRLARLLSSFADVQSNGHAMNISLSC